MKTGGIGLLAGLLGATVLALPASAAGQERPNKSERFLRVKTPHVVHRGVPRVAIRTQGRPSLFTARLNGDNVTKHLLRPNGMPRRTTLSPSEGLRRGRNRLKIKARNDAARDTDRKTIVVRSRRLPAAGRDKRISPGDKLRLDATRSIPADRRGDLAYRWRIRRKPKGSKARLRGRKTARPRLVTDRRGIYRLDLGIGERKGRRTSATSVGGRLSATSSARRAGKLAATRDKLEVAATVTPPIGLPLATPVLENGAYGISVDGTFYPNPDSSNGSVQVLSFNKSTMEYQSNSAVPIEVDPTEMQDAICGGNGIVILAVPPPIADEFAQFFGGSSELTCLVLQNESDYSDGIGLVRAGDETQNWRGQMTGYLQQSFVPVSPGTIPTYSYWYQYVAGEYVTYDTNAPDPPANGNTIQIGAADQPVEVTDTQQLPGGASGFHALAADAQSLQVADSQAFATTNGPNDQQGITDLSNWLQDYEGDPDHRVILQSIGSPDAAANPDPGDWSQAAVAISQMGGNSHIFNTVNGSYVLYGGAGMGPDEVSDGAELSQSATGDPAAIRGVLSRDDLYNFAPRVTDPGQNVDIGLWPIAYQEPEPWPAPDDSAGEQAAAQWIIDNRLQGEGIDIPGDSITGLRELYWSSNAFASMAASYFGDLECGSNPGGTTGVGFSQTDFSTVCDELGREFNWVSDVGNLIGIPGSLTHGDLQGALLGPGTYEIKSEIQTTIAKQLSNYDPGDDELVAEVTEFGSDLAWGLEELFPADEGISGLGVLAAGLGLSSDSASTLSGDAADAPIRAEADQVANQFLVNTALTTAQFSQLAGLITSDYGKLQEVANLEQTTWNWTTQDALDAPESFQASSIRWAYRELLPAQYTASILAPSNSNPPNTPPDGYQCALSTADSDKTIWQDAFSDVPSQSYFDHYDAPNSQDAYWIMLEDNVTPASSSLADALQASPTNLYLPWLFEELRPATYDGYSGSGFSCTP